MFRSRTRLRQASTTNASDASSASTSPNRRGRSLPRATSRATGVSRTVKACSTSAASAGMRAPRAAASARASAANAALARTRRMEIPATARSCMARNAGVRAERSSCASLCSASSRRPIRSRRRASRQRAWAAFARSPCASRVADAAASGFVDQARSREASAISASATTHLARATSLLDRKRAPLAAAALSRGRNHRAGPWRCREGRAPARHRGARLCLARRGGRPSRAPAPRR